MNEKAAYDAINDLMAQYDDTSALSVDQLSELTASLIGILNDFGITTKQISDAGDYLVVLVSEIDPKFEIVGELCGGLLPLLAEDELISYGDIQEVIDNTFLTWWSKFLLLFKIITIRSLIAVKILPSLDITQVIGTEVEVLQQVLPNMDLYSQYSPTIVAAFIVAACEGALGPSLTSQS